MKPNIELAIAKVAASQHGLIARRHALDLDATPAEIKYRIKTHRWEVVHRSVYRLAGVPNSWRQSLQALCLVSASFVASHRSAGRLWGLPDLKGDWLEVSAPRGCSFRHPGIWVHESLNLTAADLTSIYGIPVTTPARTLIDLASLLAPELLEEAVDDAIRRGLLTLSRLKWRLGELAENGRPGIAAVRKVIAVRTPGDCPPQSVLETRVLRLLKKWGLPEPELQFPVKENGKLIAVIDFAYPNQRVGIEADGFAFHSGRRAFRRDRDRANALEARHWRMFHLCADHLSNGGEEICRAIADALSLRLPA